MIPLDDSRKIGIGLTAFGLLFTILGVLFFFDRGLLAIGNLLFLSGISLTIGVAATVRFFSRRRNMKGSIFFLGGAFLVVIGWTFFGLVAEAYGFWLLFSAFAPTVLQFFRRVPVLGNVLDLPFVKMIVNKIAPMGGLPV